MKNFQISLKNLSAFMQAPLQLMTELEQGQKFVRTRLGPKSFVFVYDANCAREILVQASQKFPQNRMVFDRIQPLTGRKGLVQMEGEESKNTRIKMRTLFGKAPLADAQTITEEYTNEFIAELKKNPAVDIAQAMHNLILRTALKIFLDVDDPKMAHEIGHMFVELNELCGQRIRSLLPVPLFIPTTQTLRIKKLRHAIRSQILAHLQKRTKTLHEQLVDVFAEDPHLLDHCMTFIFAGHETTASSLAFTFLLLAKYPEYQKLIQQDKTMAICVYKESLRLYPPAYMLARQANTDTQFGDFKIKKSDHVIIALASIQQSEKYFAQAKLFKPERFAQKAEHGYAFFPFGAGAKSCIGERLAYVEADVVINKICSQFSISGAADKILADPMITLNVRRGQTLVFHG
ncbi:MAG: cytochrome P450 [Bdellovibrionota bacterium]